MAVSSAASIYGNSSISRIYSSPARSLARKQTSTIRIQSMATQKPITSKKSTLSGGGSVKLLTRVEELKLLTKAEKAGLLSAAEKFGLSLSTIEKLGLLSKAEELGVLSAATDPGTPAAIQTLSLGLLLLGPFCVYLVPEDNAVEVVLQVVLALVCVAGGSAAFAASTFVSNLQKSN